LFASGAAAPLVSRSAREHFFLLPAGVATSIDILVSAMGLSTGPNGPSDGIGFANASLIMSTVNGAGLTLQPDRPATTMDAALAAVFAAGHSVPDVRSTWTAYGSLRWHHILATRLGSDFQLQLKDLGPAGPAPAFALFDWFSAESGPLAVLPASNPEAPFTVPAGQGQPSAPVHAHNMQHMVVVPQLPGGWWLYGEAGKIVPMSKQRVSALQLFSDGFSATVQGSSGEAAGIQMLVAGPSAQGKVAPVHCPSAAGSAATLTCRGAAACSCA
jgi:hypothetical protein